MKITAKKITLILQAIILGVIFIVYKLPGGLQKS
jgi:hypothetical protein